MKKILTGIFLALVALMLVVSPVLADGGNAEVTCSDIDVSDDAPAVGTTIVYHGTVTIVANANSTTNYSRDYGWGYFTDKWTVASAESTAWYEVYDPDGILVASGSNTITDYDEGVRDYWMGYNTDNAYADAGQVFDWSADIPIDLVGDYTATQGGTVTVYYGKFSQTATYDWCSHQWVWGDPVPNTTTIVDGDSNQRIVTSHGNGVCLGMMRIHPYLVIQLPAPWLIERNLHDAKFFGGDGWGNPTTKDIVYSDGIWQVEIPAGTSIIMDGEWHKLSWIEIDNQGNVIGRYGSDGHITAETIELNQAITITKVGE